MTTIDAGNGQPVAGPTAQERTMIYISEELARERIRAREREIKRDIYIRRAARRNARSRVARVRRILLIR
jgi:hypothetical protein